MSNRASVWSAALAVIVVISCGTGCRSTATLQAWRPAEADIHGLRSLAVADFNGPSKLARVAKSSVMSRLDSSGCYRLIDSGAPPKDLSGKMYVQHAINHAGRLGADAVLVASVQRRADWGADVGGHRIRVGDPEFGVAIRYQLIDVRTGRIRAEDRVQLTESPDSDSDTPKEAAILDQLAARCSAKVVRAIAAHPEPVEVQLAQQPMGVGATNIREGNKRAKQGRWAEAQREWQQAVNADPDNPVALYSLGLASEALGNYPRAAQLYETANSIESQDYSQDAAQRIEASRHAHQLAMRQLNGQHNNHPIARRGVAPQPTNRHMPAARPEWNQAAPQFPPRQR